MDIGPTELIIALVIILLLFGGKKLPEIARGLGRAQHEFKEGMQNPGAEPLGGVDRLDHADRGTADPRHGVDDLLPGNNDSSNLFNWSRPNGRT